MRIARICRAKYPDLDGQGAAITGGRWNSKGTRIVYTSACGALAVLEYRVHTRLDPDDLMLYSIDVPDTIPFEQAAWMPDVRTAQHFGDVWIKSKRTLILAVPSVVVPHQINYLLNPEHPAFLNSVNVIETIRFALDIRLLDVHTY